MQSSSRNLEKTLRKKKEREKHPVVNGCATWRNWNKSFLSEKLELPAYPFKHFHVQIKHRWPITFMTSCQLLSMEHALIIEIFS